MNIRTILLPIALKILRILLTAVGSSVSTFLVARHLLSTGDQLTVVNLCADSAPALIGALPGAALQIWVWVNSFSGVVEIEQALHLPITGKITDKTVAVAQLAQAQALASYPHGYGCQTNPSIPPQ